MLQAVHEPYRTRHFSSTVAAASGTNGKLDTGPTKSERTVASVGEPWTVFAKPHGHADWVKVIVPITTDVADMKEQIMKQLPSLRDKDPSSLTLHVAKDKAGMDLEPALDSMDTVEHALAKVADQKPRIVVKVAAPTGTYAVQSIGRQWHVYICCLMHMALG